MHEVQRQGRVQFPEIQNTKLLQTLVVTAALTAITRFALQQAQKRTQKPIAPLKGNQRANAMFTAVSTSYLAASMAVFPPFKKRSFRPNPPPPQEPNVPDPEVHPVVEDIENDVVEDIENDVVEDIENDVVEDIENDVVEDSVDDEGLALARVAQHQEGGLVSVSEMMDAIRFSREGIQEALRMGNVQVLRQNFQLGGREVSIQIDLGDPRAVEECLQLHDRLLRRLNLPMPSQKRESLEGAIAPCQGDESLRAMRLHREIDLRMLHQIRRGSGNEFPPPLLPEEFSFPFELISPKLLQSVLEPEEPEDIFEDFILVGRTCLPEIGVDNQDLFGSYGILMRLMLFRNLLNEYQLLLTEAGVDLRNDLGSEQLYAALYCLTNPASGKDAFEQYEKFVDAHEALILSEKSPQVAEVCRKMAIARMTPRIQSFQEDFVKQHINAHDPFTLNNFAALFVERNKAIASSDPIMRVSNWDCQMVKLYGAMSWAHYLKINPPQLRNREDGVAYLRHATPNKYENGTVIIDPLYREFVRGAQGLVLYAAHQRLEDDGSLENEDVRCQTLIQFEQEEENLMLLFQSVENTLYKKGASTFEGLKQKIIDSFYQTEGHRLNRLPIRLENREAYRERMQEICDFIHLRFFGNRMHVNPTKIDIYGGLPEDKKTTEWHMFIMLFYYYQREDLKATYPIAFVNTGCKDDFDRGGGQNLVSDIMHLFERYGTQIPSEELQAVADSIQAPTLQLKGTPPIKYRLHPALCVANLLLTLQEEDIAAIQERGSVQNVVVERREQQPAIFTPKLARTLDEYKAVLTSLKGRSYTLLAAEMVEENVTMDKEKIIAQLKRNYANGLTFDGYYTDSIAGRGWDGFYYYNIEQIYEELIETHQLSEEAAVCVMNQLEVQIFSKPFLELKKNLEVGDLVLRGIGGQRSPITLTTTDEEEFVVTGKTQYEIVDMSRDGARVSLIDVDVTLRLPKTEDGMESGEWSWSINSIV